MFKIWMLKTSKFVSILFTYKFINIFGIFVGFFKIIFSPIILIFKVFNISKSEIHKYLIKLKIIEKRKLKKSQNGNYTPFKRALFPNKICKL